MSERANVLIVGGGVVGTSLAWCLAERGVDGIAVVDLDLAGLYASSELNAGGARATWWQPVNIESCRLTLEFFAAHAEVLGFRPVGYLWLYDSAELFERAIEMRGLQNRAGLGVEALAVGEVAERFPVLDRRLEALVGATFSPRDGLVNPNAVRAWYRGEAERLGVEFHNRHYVAGVETRRVVGAAGSLREVAAVDVIELASGDPLDEAGVVRDALTTHSVAPTAHVGELRIECDTVVNCLGAWSPIFSAKIGVPDLTEPVRRQICLVDVHREDVAPGVDLSELGMIVDASGLYFHPEGPHVLAGYSTPDEAPGFDFDYDGEAFFESEIWPRLAQRASSFERCGHVRGWAGLYAVTPDCSGIAGAVAGFGNLYEAHSFTGRGVMQSYGVGRAMAAHIATGRFEEVDLAPLTRARFSDAARWVTEDLHI
ncbi:MAG: FAD-binding oxidoreductase [Deltaproteobacteria bacterium]|nr:FAD-binding oxidoreductase [Deltaproteobacteria bacterium]MBW2359467.1 FAD-binding oxidoreductase [Deltaproteobacteria bacterium]